MFKFMVYFSAISVNLIHCLPSKNNTADYDSGGADLSYLGRSVFGEPNEESGKRVEQWNKSSKVKPQELGTYAEGDILFPNDGKRNGVISETARWPNGVVPFQFGGMFSKEQKEMIKKAMMEFHKATCIRFRRREPNDTNWFWITNNRTGCWASIGRISRPQAINLQAPICVHHETIMHELLHTIGFGHEQSRSDRDSYVTIHWANIAKEYENAFKKAEKNLSTSFGIPYDYNSVMHYSNEAFSKNGNWTITAKGNSSMLLGPRNGFTENDIKQINLMYNCTKQNSSDIDIDIM
ncbi:hypothetical protein ILUMI_22450 [Ignelater luminosus]|uniref:Metalloendopeptidase n=1 Tax=Ignelater luminosus TaxID=2038154 RepID=A0A8K0G0J0_IGNLU|nr:hypothetical protein ILUMI_22450 [Ignelater luminosus]